MMLAVATHDETHGVPDISVIELVDPMPGFPHDARFELGHLDDGGVLGTLRSLDHDGVQFLVVPAVEFYPSYAPVVGDEIAVDLGITETSDVLVLLIVHAAASLAETTVNLRAPLLVNVNTMKPSRSSSTTSTSRSRRRWSPERTSATGPPPR